MDLRINKSDISNEKYFNFLHDNIAGNLKIKDNCLEIYFWENFSFDKQPDYKMIINFGKETLNLINVYLYKIDNSVISGKLSDIKSIIEDKVSFEVIDLGYMNSVLFIKGSILENGKLNRNNILIELCFETLESFIEIKKCF